MGYVLLVLSLNYPGVPMSGVPFADKPACGDGGMIDTTALYLATVKVQARVLKAQVEHNELALRVCIVLICAFTLLGTVGFAALFI